jgi:hypothetical protein
MGIKSRFFCEKTAGKYENIARQPLIDVIIPWPIFCTILLRTY